MSMPLEEWIPPNQSEIVYTHDEAIAAKRASLNSYNAVMNKAISRGDAESIALYKQLIKQIRVDIYELQKKKKAEEMLT